MAGHIGLLSLFMLIGQSFAADWNYDVTSDQGPGNWTFAYPTCGGERQSPINIVTANVVNNDTLNDFTFTGYDNAASGQFTLTNNGHSFQVTMPDKSVSVTGGGLTNTFVLEQFHFHWGSDNTKGSEHTVDGVSHSLEIHLVHYDTSKYTNVSAALVDPQGVAVLGIFVDASDTDASADLGDLTSDFDSVTDEGNFTKTKSFPISSLLPKSQGYYRYLGSLTTPACIESVIWTVFTDPIHIKSAQMDKFRSLHTDDGTLLLQNFRPTQNLNSRIVQKSAEVQTTAVPSNGPFNAPSVVALTMCSAFNLFLN